MEEKELIEIVDKDGNSTGRIVDKEIAHDLNLLHKEIRVFIFNSNNEILIQKRKANKRYNPNKWAPSCSGHVIAYEDTLTAAIRELKEELGVIANKKSIIYCDKILEESESIRITFCYYMFLDKDIHHFTIQEEEVSEVKWLDFDIYRKLVENGDESVTLKNSMDNLKMLETLKNVLKSH